MQLVLQHSCKTNRIAMLLVLPPTSNLSCNTLIKFLTGFEREWSNAQHRYAIHFAAILQDKLHVFVACFTELRSTYMFLDEKTLVKISLNAGLNQNNLSRNRGQEDYFDFC